MSATPRDTKTSPAPEPENHNITEESEFLDIVDEASADSFPASDPPNWATGQLRHSENDEPEPESGNRAM